MIWGCFLASIIISVVDVVIVILLVDGMDGFVAFMEILKQLPATWWAVIIAVASALQYFALYLIFGWGARKLAQKLQPQPANKTAD